MMVAGARLDINSKIIIYSAIFFLRGFLRILILKILRQKRK